MRFTCLLFLVASLAPASAAAQPPDGSAAQTNAPTARAGEPVAGAATEALRSLLLGPAIELLKQNQDRLLSLMADRAVEKGLKETEDVREYLGYIPLAALLIVPLWLWRRRAWSRARAKGISRSRVARRSVVATLLVTALLWGFIQCFLFVENFKRYFSWTSPAQGLASNAIVYLIERGEKMVKHGTAVGDLVAETINAVALGKRSPEALLGHLFENAQRLKQTWAFRWGYQLYAKVFPMLEYFGPALLFVMFIVFLRFSIPGIREILSHVSGEGPPGIGFVRSLFRHLRTELFAMILFLFPYLLVIAISFLVTWTITSVAAQGIVENTLNALTLFYGGTVEPGLVVANFAGIGIFVFETVLLLLIATMIILANWMEVLHEKFHTGRSFWSYRRFIPHFIRVTFRLYFTLLVPGLLLAGTLDWLDEEALSLGPTVTMLLPLMLVGVFNLVLYLMKFFGGLRVAFSNSRWRPVDPSPATTPP